MKNFGPSRFVENILVQEDIVKLFLIADKLPSLDSTFPGTLVRITGNQPGTAGGHVYYCIEKNSVKSWIDLSVLSEYPTEGEISKNLHIEAEHFEENSVRTYTGFLNIYWSAPTETESNRLLYDVVVRKLKSYPSNPYDGEILVRAKPVRNASEKLIAQYTNAKPYKYYDLALDYPTFDEYKFRVFHVFESEVYTYNDCATVEK